MISVANGGYASHTKCLVAQERVPTEIAPEASKPKKLHGRAFYESLGSPKFVLAPMVAQSEFAWRVLTRSFMSTSTSKSLLAYSPMLHSRMFRETARFRDQHFQPLRRGLTDKPGSLDTYADPELFLDGNPSLDRPLFVQFCANDPFELLEAATYVAPFCDAVDLNLGCPQGIARTGHYGAFLQEDQELIYKLINTLHTSLSVPVTAKIRILESKEETLKYAKKLLSAGASILTVHGRHRDQKGHKTGLADWSVIRYLREKLPADTVLFANGNILRREDINRCLEETGADAVMSAEGNLYDPTIFGEVPPIGEEGREYWRGKDGKGGYRMDAVLRRYLDILYQYVLEVPIPLRKPLFMPSDPPPATEQDDAEGNATADDEPLKKKRKQDKKQKTTSPNLTAMQPHLFHMLRPLVGKHHHIRDALARCKSGEIAAFEQVLQMVEKAIREALIEYEATNGGSIEAHFADPLSPTISKEATSEGSHEMRPEYESSLHTVKECKRPWWICQPYVRPLPAEAFKNGSLTLSKKELAGMAEEERRKVERLKQSVASKISVVEIEPLPLASTSTVDLLSNGEHETINGGTETLAVPEESLVCV